MAVDFYYLDIGLKDGDVDRARQIVQSLGEIKYGKGFLDSDGRGRYTDIEDPVTSAWKFEYADFEDRGAALEALATDLDRIDEGWRACLAVG